MIRFFGLLLLVVSFNADAKLTPEAENRLKALEWGNLSIIERIEFKSNFAEAFEIVEWGCGAPCTQSVIIEVATGEIVSFVDSCYGLDFTLGSNVIAFINIENDPLLSCNNTQKLTLVDGELVIAN